ncbi:MAG TPA: hypothetical protein VNE39_03945 [Planctomycetota bacterium]|nr:hypothetical protein [Planctomycetota bacterium]
MASRTSIAPDVQAEVLRLSRRRCCLCYGLQGDLTHKDGQIAHLDRDPSNNDMDNLAWLCLQHHDEYDTRHSQSKGLTEEEVRRYREALHALPLHTVAQEQPFVIRDSTFKTDVKDAKEAIGMQVDRPAVLTNVRSELTVRGTVERAVGFSTNQELRAIMATCNHCGRPLPVACAGRPQSVRARCSHCGADNEVQIT